MVVALYVDYWKIALGTWRWVVLQRAASASRFARAARRSQDQSKAHSPCGAPPRTNFAFTCTQQMPRRREQPYCIPKHQKPLRNVAALNSHVSRAPLRSLVQVEKSLMQLKICVRGLVVVLSTGLESTLPFVA